MKKKLLVTTGIIATATAIFSAGVFAATDIRLFVNGKQSTADIQIIDGSSYVPLRAVAEMLGADVKWDGDARTITITGKDYNPNAANVKSYPVNVTINSGPMTLKITKVSLDPTYTKDEYSKPFAAVVLDVSVENTSNDTVNWYPAQGTLAFNTKEQSDVDTFYSDDVDGEFIGKVVKKGRIAVPIKNGLDGITSFTYKINGAVDGTTYNDDVTTSVILK